jgi:hypothetical protein
LRFDEILGTYSLMRLQGEEETTYRVQVVLPQRQGQILVFAVSHVPHSVLRRKNLACGEQEANLKREARGVPGAIVGKGAALV